MIFLEGKILGTEQASFLEKKIHRLKNQCQTAECGIDSTLKNRLDFFSRNDASSVPKIRKF